VNTTPGRVCSVGIKQKSLFDYLMEDKDALHAIVESRPTDSAYMAQFI